VEHSTIHNVQHNTGTTHCKRSASIDKYDDVTLKFSNDFSNYEPTKNTKHKQITQNQ